MTKPERYMSLLLECEQAQLNCDVDTEEMLLGKMDELWFSMDADEKRTTDVLIAGG